MIEPKNTNEAADGGSSLTAELCAASFLVCKVGGLDYFGNEYEYVAARLNKGDRVIFKGTEETVEYTWFYEGPIVKLANGASIYPALGDIFNLSPNAQ